MVVVTEPTFSGCVILAKPVGMFRMTDDGARDDKIVCVPVEDPQWDDVEDVDDLPEQFRNEIRHFFAIYKELEGERVEIEDWHRRDAAIKEIEASRRRFAER